MGQVVNDISSSVCVSTTEFVISWWCRFVGTYMIVPCFVSMPVGVSLALEEKNFKYS